MPVTLMRDRNAETLLNYLIQQNFLFLLTTSNYTTKITSDIINRTFVTTKQSKRTFAAFSKLKADLKNKPVPNVPAESVRYFEHDFKKPAFFKEVVNIDLRSAYARIFRNDNLISEETFNYLAKCRKQERLASVGMLASRKKIFKFKNGKPVSFEEKISDMSGFFFYSVKRIQEIMSELKRICGDKYLFTWVDGIYFLPDERVLEQCEDYLKQIDFGYSRDDLKDFDIKIFPSKVLVSFVKEESHKRFNLPTVSSQFKKTIMESIILLNKTKQNEKSKIKNSN